MRETLFNWLAPVIAGARCLDLFAGSGILGVEALSRGAEHVTFVDTDAASLDAIAANLTRLDGRDRATLELGDAADYLRRPATACDVVFLDPPFGSDLPARLAPVLTQGGWLKPTGRVYLEAAALPDPESLDAAGLCIVKRSRAGRVFFGLWAPVSPSGAVPS